MRCRYAVDRRKPLDRFVKKSPRPPAPPHTSRARPLTPVTHDVGAGSAAGRATRPRRGGRTGSTHDPQRNPRPAGKNDRPVSANGPGASPGRRHSRSNARILPLRSDAVRSHLQNRCNPPDFVDLCQQAVERADSKEHSRADHLSISHEQPRVRAEAPERLPRPLRVRLRQGDQTAASRLRDRQSASMRRMLTPRERREVAGRSDERGARARMPSSPPVLNFVCRSLGRR